MFVLPSLIKGDDEEKTCNHTKYRRFRFLFPEVFRDSMSENVANEEQMGMHTSLSTRSRLCVKYVITIIICKILKIIWRVWSGSGSENREQNLLHRRFARSRCNSR
jgi:hypothetical protein